MGRIRRQEYKEFKEFKTILLHAGTPQQGNVQNSLSPCLPELQNY
jgi:hypothetical protein